MNKRKNRNVYGTVYCMNVKEKSEEKKKLGEKKKETN